MVGVCPAPTLNDIVALFALQVCGAVPVLLHARWTERQLQERSCVAGLPYVLEQDSLQPVQNKKPGHDGRKMQEESLRLFTSGSSGEAKLVELSIQTLLRHAHLSNQVTGFAGSEAGREIWCLSLPLYHIGGLALMYRVFAAGASLLLPAKISQEAIAAAILHRNMQFVSLVPSTLEFLLDQKELLERLQGLRCIMLGGEAPSTRLLHKLKSTPLRVFFTYGMTETCSHISGFFLDEAPHKIGSSGRALPGIDLNIAENGCLIVRGETLAQKSISGLEGSEEVLNGSYQTSDKAEIDEDGFLWIKGRADRVILSGGENISLDEVENLVLAEYADLIQEVVALPVAHKGRGERFVLFLVFRKEKEKEGASCDLSRILTGMLRPERIIVLPSLPRLESGKIDVVALKRSFT